MTEKPNPWRQPEHARALGLVYGFVDRNDRSMSQLRYFLERLGMPPEAKIRELDTETIVLLSRIIEGYVDAAGPIR